MSLVFDKHEVEMKPLHDLLRENKNEFYTVFKNCKFYKRYDTGTVK